MVGHPVLFQSQAALWRAVWQDRDHHSQSNMGPLRWHVGDSWKAVFPQELLCRLQFKQDQKECQGNVIVRKREQVNGEVMTWWNLLKRLWESLWPLANMCRRAISCRTFVWHVCHLHLQLWHSSTLAGTVLLSGFTYHCTGILYTVSVPRNRIASPNPSTVYLYITVGQY